MSTDLTQEEIVTQILSSNEILRQQKENFYISNPEQNLGNLGLFLSSLPNPTEQKSSKYTFIKSTWNVQ